MAMNTQHVRTAFVEFFRARGHTHLPSSSLIPHGDPSLLFTNSGMVQFKDVFLGTRPPPESNSAVTVQRCVRAGGKHNDLDNVGYTPRHHTFFEMLGNFSFRGRHTKEDAIQAAWQFLTDTVKLPESRLAVSVHHKDPQSAEIWEHKVGVAKDRIFRFDADNIWSMGDGAGPYGYCTEIFFDKTMQSEHDHDTRWLEIWNVVFMQYFKDAAGKHAGELPALCVDTGMGLERLMSVLQGVKSNYETDEFVRLIDSIRSRVGLHVTAADSDPKVKTALHVVADHLRAVSFLIADGVVPKNVGRGYVLRRIMRRAIRYGAVLQSAAGRPQTQPFLYELCPVVATIMGDAYPFLQQRLDAVCSIVHGEELAFLSTLDKGIGLLDTFFANAGRSKEDSLVIPAATAFELHDTYGFPVDLTCQIAREHSATVDMAGFESRMQAQREKAKSSSLNGERSSALPPQSVIDSWKRLNVSKVRFTGYTSLVESDAMLMACAVDERDAASGWVVISPSPFYAESGGQVGDVGQIRIFLSDASSMTLSVLDVQNAFDGCSVLRVCTSSENDASGASRSDNALSMLDLMDALNSSSSQTSAHASSLVFGLKDARRVDARVDAVRRNRIRIHHTATHLLHAALRRVLGEHRVVQAGSKVDDARLRFDFTFSRGLSKDELTAVQVDVEKAIAAALSVNTNEMLLEEATKSGAAALFSEKYADKVRVVSAGDGSKELCGGTHAESTAELYPFRIMSEGSVAAGTRRIEAVAGPAAVRVLEEESQLLHQVATLVGDKVSAVPARIKQLQEKQSACEASLWKATHQLVAKSVQERAQVTLPSRSSQQVLCCFLQSGMSEMPAALKGHPDVLRAVLSDIQQQNPSSVVALIADARLMVSSPPALHADLPALGVMNDLLAVLGGKGGGSKEFSQGRMAAAYSWDQLLQRVAASLPVAKSA